MALLALQRLGADDTHLTAWHGRYAARLEPAPAAQAWPAGDPWPGRLGDLSAWPAYRDLFGQWIGHEGGADVLAQVLPVLMPGCGAGAFHGPIRVAYAARRVMPGTGRRLAYWACRFLPLGPLPAAPGTQADPETAAARLRAGRSKHGLIFERMMDAARDPSLHAQVAQLAIDPDTLERLARLSAMAYARQRQLHRAAPADRLPCDARAGGLRRRRRRGAALVLAGLMKTRAAVAWKAGAP
jgi:hypothetical protein